MKDRPSLPAVDEQGIIIMDTVNDLPFVDLQRWIMMVLFGDEPAAGGGREEPPHVFLKRVYDQVDPHVRETFEEAVLNHLADFVRDSDREWEGECADELLLLVAAVFRDSHRSGAPVDLLLCASDQELLRETGQLSLHWRVLQTLIGVRHRATPEFWHRQYMIGGDEYALIVLAGLSLTGVSLAVEWVIRNRQSEAVINALLSRLPWLVEQYGTAPELSSGLRYLLPRLPKPQAVDLQDVGERLGLLNVQTRGAGIFAEWSAEELRLTAHAVGLELPGELAEADELRLALEERLAVLADEDAFIGESTPDAQVITGLRQAVRRDGYRALPQRTGEKLWQYGSEIIKRAAPGEDLVRLLGYLHFLRTWGRDVKREIEEETEERTAGR